ncbi:MAG: hypothetical protein P8Y80_01165 [Acidobacteriota bacterium]
MLVILPFEEEYYRARGVEVEYVGHPLLEDFNPNFNRESNRYECSPELPERRYGQDHEYGPANVLLHLPWHPRPSQ